MLDIDECIQGTHNGTHACHNIDGSYMCLCRDGYQLHSDNRTFVGMVVMNWANLIYPYLSKVHSIILY